MKYLKILFLFLMISFFTQISEAQYYVSVTGSDNNPGTLEQPFQTIQKAADIMTAGDTCYIMAGTYREMVTPANDGQQGLPVVFRNYQDERVVIVGSDTVGGWEPYTDNIYKAYFPDSVVQLFVDRQRAFPARYPDFVSGDMYSTADWSPVYATADGDATFSGMDKPEGYWVGGYCKILTGHKWIAHVGKISSSSGNTVHCDERSAPWNDYNPGVYLGNGLGYIIKHLHALDAPNEWHWQNDTLYYYPLNGSGIDTSVVEARTRLYGFDCGEKSYIEIRNIHFVWASVNFGNATGCVLDGGSVWFPEPFYYYQSGWGRNAGPENDYSIDDWDGKGIHVSGTGNVVKNCYVAYSWGDGISVGGFGNTVENCLVENCDWSATDAGLLCASGKDHNILHNTLHTTARSVLVHRRCDNTNIKYNHLYDCGLMNDDLGLTYSYHTNGEGSEIAYNWVHDNHASGTASGIYLDNYDTAYVVHHNAVWNCTYAIQTNKPAVDHEIYNNTVWNCTYAQWAWGPSGTYIINQKVINNLSDKQWSVGTYFETNLTTNNPMFVDADNGDFRLQEGSPAIDYGTVIPGITNGYTGSAPDAGAYEFGGEDWVPGSDIEIPDLSDIIFIPGTEPQDLIAYYPFSGNAEDESGNGYHAGEVQAELTTDMEGNPNSAYAFNGTDNYIVIPHIGVDLSHDFTITYWFRPNDLQTRQWLFGNRHTVSGDEANGLESDIYEGELRFFWPAQLSLTYEITTSEWQFVAYTKSGSSYKLYYNAELADEGTNTTSPADNDPWCIGADFNQQGWGAFFNGKMDEIRIYGRPLSEDEIQFLYDEYITGYNEPAEDPGENKVRVYPNPGHSVFRITGVKAEPVTVEVFNDTGYRVRNSSSLSVDLSSCASGMYLFKVTDEYNRVLLLDKVIKR